MLHNSTRPKQKNFIHVMCTVSGQETSVHFILICFLAVPLVVKPEHFWGMPPAPVHTSQMDLYPPLWSLDFPQWSEKAELLDTTPGLPALLFLILQIWRKQEIERAAESLN